MGQPIDCYLAGITQRHPGLSAGPSSDIDTGMRRAQKMRDAATAVQDMGNHAKALEKRWDALCANAKAHVAPPEDPEPLAFTS